MTLRGKTQPFFNIDEEKAVLGAIIGDPAKLLPLAKRELDVEDFFVDTHKVIFKEMLELSDNGRAFDGQLLISNLTNDILRNDVQEAMVTFLEPGVTLGAFSRHVSKVRELSERRRVDGILEQMQAYLLRGDPVEDILADGKAILGEYLTTLLARNSRDPDFVTIEQLLSTRYEKHEPVIDRGLWPFNGQLLIAGESGVGKSLLRNEMAIHISKGLPWLGHFKIPQARRVAIFQYENTEQIERTRLKTMCYAKGLTVPSIRIWAKRKQRLNLSTKKDRSILKERVKQSEAEVVFYDCLSNFHSTDEIKNVELRQVLDTFTEIDADLGTSSVVLHHFNKRTRENSNDPRSRIRGGTTIVDWASSAMTISPRPHEQRHLLQLDFVKVRDGPRIRPLLVERNKDFLLEVAEDETLCPPGRVKDILVGELDGKAKNQTQLKKAVMKIIGCSERSAEGYIRRAVEMDQVKVIDRGHGKAKTYVV